MHMYVSANARARYLPMILDQIPRSPRIVRQSDRVWPPRSPATWVWWEDPTSKVESNH